MSEPRQREIHEVLAALAQGGLDDRKALDRLFKIIAAELRSIAASLMARERQDHTLQPTALVNEAYLRLVGSKNLRLDSRAHFLGIATRAMRQILIEHARRRDSDKRGGGWERVTLSNQGSLFSVTSIEILELLDTLDSLKKAHSRSGEIAELHLIGGLTQEEIAEILGCTSRTVRKDWRIARMWLCRELAMGGGEA